MKALFFALLITGLIAAFIDAIVVDFMDTRCLVNMFTVGFFDFEFFNTGNYCNQKGYY